MKKLLWIVFVGLVFSSCNRESNLITNTGFAFGRTYTIKYYALDAETDFKDEIELYLMRLISQFLCICLLRMCHVLMMVTILLW